MSTAVMSKQEFFSHIENHIAEKFDEPVEVKILPIDKGYTSYTGCNVNLHPGESYAVLPTANLDKIYDDYENGCSIEDAMDKVVEIVTMPVPKKIGIGAGLKKNLSNFEWVKEHLFARLVNVDNLRPNVIHRVVADDLALCAYIIISMDHKGVSSCAVQSDMSSLWDVDITDEGIMNLAIENSPNIFEFSCMTIGQALGFSEDLDDAPLFYIVTNDSKVNGASAIFYEGAAEKVRDIVGEDYYILPSSVNEVIAVPKSLGKDVAGLAVMVKSINGEMVSDDEWLSDSIYSYDSETNEIRKEVI